MLQKVNFQKKMNFDFNEQINNCQSDSKIFDIFNY